MECLVIGLGTFGRAVAKNLKLNEANVVGIDLSEKSLQEAESLLDESIKIDASIESNLRHIGVEHFHHCFVCIGDNMEASLSTVLNLSNLGVTKITARSSSGNHTLLLQKIGSINVVAPEIEISRQVVKEALTDIENYIRLREDMVVLTVPVPDLMVYKSLREMSLIRKYRVQILWMDKFVPYIDSGGKEGIYEENISFIPVDYRFNTFDRISIFGNISDIQVFIQSMSKNTTFVKDIISSDIDEIE